MLSTSALTREGNEYLHYDIEHTLTCIGCPILSCGFGIASWNMPVDLNLCHVFCKNGVYEMRRSKTIKYNLCVLSSTTRLQYSGQDIIMEEKLFPPQCICYTRNTSKSLISLSLASLTREMCVAYFIVHSYIIHWTKASQINKKLHPEGSS